jgi:hypothetical protein
MEIFVVRVVPAGDHPVLRGFVQHVGSRAGKRFRGSAELVTTIETFLEPPRKDGAGQQGVRSAAAGPIKEEL